MIADLNVHWDMAETAYRNPCPCHVDHARGGRERFWQKMRDWNRTEMVERWRERWAELANERLAELDIDARIDHRSLEAQGIALDRKPDRRARQTYRGPTHRGRRDRADRAEMHREIARGNGARIIADPSLAWDAVTYQQSTFTRRDIARFANRHSDGLEQFNAVLGRYAERPIWSNSQGRSRRGSVHHPPDDRGRTAPAPRRRTDAERERHEVLDTNRKPLWRARRRAASPCPASR